LLLVDTQVVIDVAETLQYQDISTQYYKSNASCVLILKSLCYFPVQVVRSTVACISYVFLLTSVIQIQ